MNRIEHLEKIRDKCLSLIEEAKKRTPGEWRIRRCPCGHPSCNYSWPGPMSGAQGTGFSPNDAAFISSCAGRAEAGWKATVGFVDLLLIMESRLYVFGSEQDAADNLITDWPKELL